MSDKTLSNHDSRFSITRTFEEFTGSPLPGGCQYMAEIERLRAALAKQEG